MFIIVRSFFDQDGYEAPSVVGRVEDEVAFMASLSETQQHGPMEGSFGEGFLVTSCWDDDAETYDSLSERGWYYLIVKV